MKTARKTNAEACGRECRNPGDCVDWPGCSCPALSRPALVSSVVDHRVVLGQRRNTGPWHAGSSLPKSPGFYYRLSLLGAWVDYFDGKVWRRRTAKGVGHRVERVRFSPANGIVCANQDLPWRSLYWQLGIGGVRYTLAEIGESSHDLDQREVA